MLRKKNGTITPRRLLTYFNIMVIGPYDVYDFAQKTTITVENPNLVMIATTKPRELIKKFSGSKNKGKLKGLRLNSERSNEDFTPRVGDIIIPDGKLTDEEILDLNPRAFEDVYDYSRITTSLDYNDARNYVKLVMGGKTSRPAASAPKGGNQTRRAQTPEQKISWTE